MNWFGGRVLLLWFVLLSAPVAQSIEYANGEVPTRVIQLPVWEDGHQWARDRQLIDWRVRPGTGSKQYLMTRLDEQAWKKIQPVCEEGAHCLPDSCQQVRDGTTAQRWLLSVPPDLQVSLAGGSPGCPELLELWQGQFPELLPANCWQLQQGTGCETVLTPGVYLKPQVRNGHILVMLPTGGGLRSELVKTLGVTLLEAHPLGALDGQLLSLYQPDHSLVPSLLKRLKESYPSAVAEVEYRYFPLIRWSAENLDQPVSMNPLASIKTELAIALIGTGTSEAVNNVAGSSLIKEDLTGHGNQPGLLGDAQVGLLGQSLPGAQLYNFQVCSHSSPGQGEQWCWGSSLIKALDRAIVSSAEIIQVGIGGPPSPILRLLVQEAQRRQRLVLSGAGEGGAHSPPVYPAAWPEVKAITAVDRHGRLYRHANQGAYVSLAAPGVNWPLASTDTARRLVSGTALAATYVSVSVAQLASVLPDLTVRQVFDRLVEHSTEVGPAGPDRYFGAGLINGCRLLSESESMRLNCQSEWEARN